MPSITYDPVDTQAATGALPRAQGASFTPAVGEAIEHVGMEGSRLAADMNRINYQQKISDGVTSIKQNLMSADEKFSTYMEQQKANMPVNGAGYVDTFKSKFDDWYGQFIDQYQDPRLKKIAAEQAATLHNRFYNQAASWQIGTNRAWRINTFDQSIQHDAATLDADPTQYEALKKNQIETINTLSGDLHPTDRITLTNKVDATYAQAAALSWARMHPQNTVNAILGVTPSAPDTITGKIVNAAGNVSPQAQRAGLSPNVALAVANIENDTFDPTRKNPLPGATAQGLFQMIDSTWAEKGGTPGNRNDPDAQAQLGVKNLADNSRALSDSLKRQLSPGEIYSTQWGLGFAGSLAKAPANMPIRDVFARAGQENPDAAAAANGVAGMTAGQVRDHFETLMRDRMQRTVGFAAQTAQAPDTDAKTPLPWLNDLPPSQREAVLSHAQSQLRHDDAGEKASLRQTIGDVEAAYNSGQNPVQSVDPGQVLRTFGSAEGAAINNRLMQAQWYGSAVSQLATATPAQTRDILAQADSKMGANAPGSFGYATAQARSQSLHAAAADINNKRIADPVGQDQQSLQLTKPLDMSNPQFLTGPLAARYEQAAELQRTWGMKDYKPLSDSEAAGLTDFLSKGPPSQIVQYLTSARVAAGEHSDRYSALMQQIAPKAPMMAVAGAVAPYDAQMAQLILTGSSALKDEKVLGVAVDPKLFEQWWNTNKGQAFGSYVDNSRLNLDAAKAAYAAALPADKRNSKVLDEDTMRNVANRIAPVVDFNGPTLVPPGMTHDTFVNEMAARYSPAMTKAGYDPAEYRFNLMRFVPLPHADGVYQAYSGTVPVQGAVIDLNTPPDVNFTPVSMQESPTDYARKEPKGMGTRSFYRGR
jgi:hypothetical protein